MLKRGFTIVELLIVVVVIGILAAVIIVSYIGITQSATVSQLQSSLTQAAKSLGLYKAQNDIYPPSLAAVGLNYSDYSYHNWTDTGGNSLYCLTLANGSTLYSVSNIDTTPLPGGCGYALTGALGWWMTDGTSPGNDHAPTSTTRLNATVNNVPLTTGRSGGMGAGVFNGTNSYMTIPSLSFHRDSFTMMVWFKTSSTNDQKIISPSSIASTHYIQMYNSNMRVCLSPTCVVGVTAVADNSWHVAAIVGDRDSIRLYLDGRQTPELSLSPSSVTDSTGLVIGADSNHQHVFTGNIVSLAVWNRPLSFSEMKLFADNT